MHLSIILMLLPLTIGCSYASNQSQKISHKQAHFLTGTHIMIRTSEYYTNNPAQGRPADGSLKAGTEVQLINQAGSYTLVKIPSRIKVYVASTSLKPIAK